MRGKDLLERNAFKSAIWGVGIWMIYLGRFTIGRTVYNLESAVTIDFKTRYDFTRT
jgi:hypothetical protein